MKRNPRKWYPFDPTKGSRQKRPPIKKYVLVLRESEGSGLPRSIAVGYRKNGGGDKQSPWFITPGIGGQVLAWCDCLPDEMKWPEEATSLPKMERASWEGPNWEMT